MNDDELIRRLQQALHEQAEDLQPAPGTVPTPDAVEAFRSGGAAQGTGDDNLYRLEPGERRTAEYTLLPPTGPVPIFGRGGGRRWPPVVGIGAVVAVAAAVVTAVLLSGGHHPVTVGPAATTATSTTVAPRPTTSVPAPTTTTPTTVGRPATTVAPAATVTVPAGFQPGSVTFVSPDQGWALGRDLLATGGNCAAMARTTDGGYRWSAIGAPPVQGLCGSGSAPVLSLRFADPNDGWVYTTATSGSSQLWSTHDGGTTWTDITLPLPGGTIGALEASGGWVHMVVYGPCATGTAGCQGQTVEQILNSPVGSDGWTKSSQQPSIGAGPVLSPQLTLWGSAGWLVNTNRTVVSGAELTGGTQWSAWTPPCSSAHGAGLVAAASATDLVAVCAEGMWGTPDPGTTAGQNRLWVSTDGGRSFTAAGSPGGDQPESITAAPGHPQTIVVADGQQGLLASFNGGANWTTVEPGSAAGSAATPGNVFTYVGFTTPTQGVAISTQPTPTLFMTRDGGATWAPVSF